jgi:hypothetical protein
MDSGEGPRYADRMTPNLSHGVESGAACLPLAGVERPAELRNAVRFPLRIPLRVFTDRGEIAAVTENISATGIAFLADTTLEVQAAVRFSLKMPAETMGTPHDVVVHCAGRVVRCIAGAECSRAAAVIDEYYFSQ